MKKVMIVILVFVLIQNLCACGGSVGSVSSATDPLTYFISDSSWSLTEIENQFGSFETSAVEDYSWYSITQYNKSNVSAFGESWIFWIRVMKLDSEERISGNFTFAQNSISDKDFISYRDKIIAYYTELFGDPVQQYASTDMPVWFWQTSTVSIILQDCRAQTGSMNLTVGI